MQEGANETSRLGRALALALCTLWGNILFLDGSGSVLLSAPFASRMASMAFSVVGFAAAWLVARSCTASPMRCRVALLGVCAFLSSAGSFLHFSGVAWLPECIDWVPTAVFSVAFTFLLVACGEVYAEISAGRAVVYASVSYMLAYLGSTVVTEMGLQIVCVVETLLPLAVFVLVVQPVRFPASDGPAKGMPVPLAKLVSVTLEAIPARVLAAIGITYLPLGPLLPSPVPHLIILPGRLPLRPCSRAWSSWLRVSCCTAASRSQASTRYSWWARCLPHSCFPNGPKARRSPLSSPLWA